MDFILGFMGGSLVGIAACVLASLWHISSEDEFRRGKYEER